MAQWTTFVGFVGVILGLLLALTHASKAIFEDASGSSTDSAGRTPSSEPADQPTGIRDQPAENADQPTLSGNGAPLPTDSSTRTVDGLAVEDEEGYKSTPATGPELSTPALLANVTVSQGLFAVLLVTLAWYTEIPAWAFGLAPESFALSGVATGIAVGSILYILNEAAATVCRQWGFETPTGLREALAPETAAGWAVLLVIVLPIIAGFEELLFRGALIGVIYAGFEVPLWLLAVGSSVTYALGHGAQGRLGIVVTGLLGLGLAAVFVRTGSLVVVIVAHYVINVLEFVVHEGIEPT
jgi:membrane protease YdiL (CAAX protease family)